MAANTINQLSTANTFQHWLNATELLIATANLLTNGNGESFYANTRLIIGGSGANVSLNVETSATINTQTSNTVNTVNATVRNLVVTANVENVNVTNDLFVGDDLTVYGESTLVGDTTISGNLTVSGNLILDAIGFDDLKVNGSATIANTLTVTGNTQFSNLSLSGSIAYLNVSSGMAVTPPASFANNVTIAGDLTVSGNIILDEIGFDDLKVNGSASIANTLTVVGASNFTGNATFVNANVTNTLTANLFVGNANTAIYQAIDDAGQVAIAYSIALG
jgi:cytoskeletal protein CcmA (bactofilin family)